MVKGKKTYAMGVWRVLIANIYNLIVGLLNGFLLPKMLSVSTYGSIKTYQLYMSYVGVAAIGYADGLYLKYGGYNFQKLNKREIDINRGNMIISQFIIEILMILFSMYYENKILLMFALSILPKNMIGLYNIIFQATGEFELYGKLTNQITFFLFLVNIFFLFVFKGHTYYFLVGYVLAYYIIWILTEIKIKKLLGFKIGIIFSIREFINHSKAGFWLMIGNLSSIIMTSSDRWFVKIFMQENYFAYYSFAISIESLILVFINTITTSLYNYFCINNDERSKHKLKNLCMLASTLLVSSAFAAAFIIRCFLDKYSSSITIIFVLFYAKVFYIIVQGVYANNYKALKKQKIYFFQLISILVISVILNIVSYLLWNSMEGYAYATLLAMIIWYFVCEISNASLRSSIKENTFLFFNMILFIILGYMNNYLLGMILYLFGVCISSILFMPLETKYYVIKIREMCHSLYHK